MYVSCILMWCDLHVACNVLCTVILHAVVYKHASFSKTLGMSYKIHACTLLASVKFKSSCTVALSKCGTPVSVTWNLYYIASVIRNFKDLWHVHVFCENVFVLCVYRRLYAQLMVPGCDADVTYVVLRLTPIAHCVKTNSFLIFRRAY